jgi:hypothetical protein
VICRIADNKQQLQSCPFQRSVGEVLNQVHCSYSSLNRNFKFHITNLNSAFTNPHIISSNLAPMSSYALNSPLPTTAQDVPSAHNPSPNLLPHPRRPKRLKQTSSAESHPPQKRIKVKDIKDQRRELTQSILSTLPRDELEKLLLDAALGNTAVMQEVIKATGLKKAGISAFGDVLDQESSLERANPSPEHQEADGDGDDSRDRNLEVKGKKKGCIEMDSLKGVEGEGPLQFHHITRRQFELRKARITESLRREME